MTPLPLVTDSAAAPRPAPHRKPEWLKVRAPGGERYAQLKSLLRGLDLHTVCEEAACPNIGECWGGGTMTVMLLGDTCTRGCRFCNVKTAARPAPPDEREPEKVAHAIAQLSLEYVVMTMVDRDDLPDGGAEHVARTVRALKASDPHVLVEVLVGDFAGDMDAVDVVARSGADVLAHNVETVERLQRTVRDARCGWRLSLDVLARMKATSPLAFTKSSLMVGHGESEGEVREAMAGLRSVGVDVLTIGQYLRPSTWHLPVETYVPPSTFQRYEALGREAGFAFTASGPLVRSSYRAGELFLASALAERRGKKARGATSTR